MTERVILAGWGGQGMILLGKLLATIMMRQGREVTAFPCYGAEVRGGTAHSQVVYSTEPIYSPVVEEADALIIMNQQSYDRFCERLVPGGIMILNTTMVVREKTLPAATILRLRATDEANHLGDVRVANIMMLGAYRAARNFAPRETVEEVLRAALVGRRARLLDLNLRALVRGEELAAAQMAS